MHGMARVCTTWSCIAMITLDDDAKTLLDAANFGHLSTLQAGGQPKLDVVWVGREGNRVIVATDARSIKAVNTARDPRVALSVVAFDDPYFQLLLRGSVVETRTDADLAALDALSQKYLGSPFPRRTWSSRLVLVIEPHLARSYRSALRDPRTPTRP